MEDVASNLHHLNKYLL